jgi:molybdopterin-containing oxidoreductase family membrane subunit
MSKEMKKSMESVAKMGALMMAIIIFFTSWKMITA